MLPFYAVSTSNQSSIVMSSISGSAGLTRPTVTCTCTAANIRPVNSVHATQSTFGKNTTECGNKPNHERENASTSSTPSLKRADTWLRSASSGNCSSKTPCSRQKTTTDARYGQGFSTDVTSVLHPSRGGGSWTSVVANAACSICTPSTHVACRATACRTT